MPFETLIAVDDLIIADPSCTRIVDCRATLGDPDAGPRAFAAGHVPGAVHAHLERDLSGPIVARFTGRHPLPEPHVLAAWLGANGIGNATQVVAYDADTGAFAARLWWLLRWLGHRAAAVLDGGFAAWRAAGHPVELAATTPARARFDVRAPLERTIEAAEIVRRGSELRLVDARARPRFRGDEEPIDRVAGHIPGATSLPFDGNLAPDRRFLDRAALARRFAPLVGAGADVVCYCGSGVTACHDVLALRHAGYSDGVLYAGSWSEWIQDPSRPIARGD